MGLGARLLTILLRHRIYLYATGVPVGATEGTLRHVFVLQNMEPNDLQVPFQIQVSTVNGAGHIKSVRLYCGRQGPFGQVFEESGHERHVLTSPDFSALETWKVVCETNEDAEEIRLILAGWDLRRRIRRWWAPAIPQGGLRITSRRGEPTRAYSREPETIFWVAVLMLVVGYVAAVRLGAGVEPPTGWVWPFQQIVDYWYGLGAKWRPGLDWPILAALLVLGWIVRRIADRGHWREVALGYLEDKHWRSLLRIRPASQDEKALASKKADAS